MPTSITYSRNALMSGARLNHPDGGQAFVWCAIPGGRPFMTLTRDGDRISIVNAPQCDTHAEFKAFVSERFGGES